MSIQPTAPISSSSDQSLLRGIREGSQDAAAALYHRYAARLHALVKVQCSQDLARRLEPADLVQSVFGSFFEKASEGYYVVPAGEDLWGLLMVITLNKIRNKAAYHGASKRNARLTSGLDDIAELTQSQESDEAFLRMIIQEAMEELPPMHKVIIDLRLQGYEVAEIANRSERSKRTIERVLQEFRTKLQAALKPDA